MLILILGIVAAILAFLDLVLFHFTEYRRHILLQFAVLLICIAVILQAAGMGAGTLH